MCRFGKNGRITNMLPVTFMTNMSKGYPTFAINGGAAYLEQAKRMLEPEVMLNEGDNLYSIVGYAPTEDELIAFLEKHGLEQIELEDNAERL